jgi:hypothetical protein
MSLIKTTKWAASVGFRLTQDVAIWALRKIEKLGEGHSCSQLYKDAKDVATVGTIFNRIDLTENRDHIHHDNDTV